MSGGFPPSYVEASSHVEGNFCSQPGDILNLIYDFRPARVGQTSKSRRVAATRFKRNSLASRPSPCFAVIGNTSGQRSLHDVGPKHQRQRHREQAAGGCSLKRALPSVLSLFHALNKHNVKSVLFLFPGSLWEWDDFSGVVSGSPGTDESIVGDREALANYLRTAFAHGVHYWVSSIAIAAPAASSEPGHEYGDQSSVAGVTFHVESSTRDAKTSGYVHGYTSSKEVLRCDTHVGIWKFGMVLIGTPRS